jgi:large subunit ribosomal protein L18
MKNIFKKTLKRNLRTNRVRAKIYGTKNRPRMSIYISNNHVSAQIINDDLAITLVSATSIGKDYKGTMSEKASQVGLDIAVKAKKAKISKVVLDRGSKLYHGRIKAFADAARNGGLEF